MTNSRRTSRGPAVEKHYFKRSYLWASGYCFKSGNNWQLLGNEFSWYDHNQWRFFSYRFKPTHMRIYFLTDSGYKDAFLQPRCLKNVPIIVHCTRRQGNNCHTLIFIRTFPIATKRPFGNCGSFFRPTKKLSTIKLSKNIYDSTRKPVWTCCISYLSKIKLVSLWLVF